MKSGCFEKLIKLTNCENIDQKKKRSSTDKCYNE